jgi:hypothetical protein
MAAREPFIRYQTPANRQEPDALLGFALPFLPDMRTSPWLTGSTPRERLHEALQLQVRLIHALWRSAITAFDLRFIGTEALPGIAIALLCRVRRPPSVPPARFCDHCLALARYASRLFADSGFELQPLLDEASLARYIAPFRFHVAAEVRKAEELLVLQETYTEYEVYATYPWAWTVQNRLRLFEALLHRQSDCMVSVYLEPTQLSAQEQSHLSHATSPRMRSLLHAGSPAGDAVYQLYATYARNLQQPYLLRTSIAAATPGTTEQIGRMFIDELSTGQDTGTAAPVLVYPQNHQEWQMACQSLWQLSWFPWGINRGADLAGTARLRYLVDAETASMAFRIPVAMQGDISGIPVRALYLEPATPATSSPGRSTGVPATPFTPPINSTGPDTSTQIRQPGTPAFVLTGMQAPEDLIGHTLGNCQIEALLGKGGFGAVYRARQTHLDRVVAVKVVLAMLTASGGDQQQLDKLLRRFAREAQALARMDHPHILPLYEYRQQPIPYLIMPYIPGGSLADELQASGHRPLPVQGVAALLAQVASALDHAHGQQLVHRDLKPHNLLRHADGRILLSDFGIVQFEDGSLTALTTIGSHSPYTPAYASPEQHQWLPVDYRSDIYSLGIIVYELLCGHRPFSVPYEYVHTAPPPLRNFGVSVPPALEAVVQKALAKRPDDRYQSAGAMASAFQTASEHY